MELQSELTRIGFAWTLLSLVNRMNNGHTLACFRIGSSNLIGKQTSVDGLKSVSCQQSFFKGLLY